MEHQPAQRQHDERAGEQGLRAELGELDRDTLEKVVQKHPPHHTAPPSTQTLCDEELIGYIVDGVKRG